DHQGLCRVEIGARYRGGRLRVSAAAEEARHGGGVDSVRTAAHDDEDTLVHLDEEDERPCVGEVDDLVCQVRDSVDVLRPVHGGDENLFAVRRDGLQTVHQRLEQFSLVGGQW